MPYKRFYIGKPSPIRSLTEMRTTKETVFFKWQDSDGGESDIHSYRIISVEGFWGEHHSLGTVEVPEFTHIGRAAGKTYSYKIVPINAVAEGDSPETFEARTQSP